MSANRWVFTALFGLTTLVTTSALFPSVSAQADSIKPRFIPRSYTKSEIKKPDSTNSDQVQIEGKINLDSSAGASSIDCSKVKIEVEQEQLSDGFRKKIATTKGQSDCRYSISFNRSISAAAINVRIFAATQDPNLSGSSSINNFSWLQNDYTVDLTLHRASLLR